jgi:hypothetical protein
MFPVEVKVPIAHIGEGMNPAIIRNEAARAREKQRELRGRVMKPPKRNRLRSRLRLRLRLS